MNCTFFYPCTSTPIYSSTGNCLRTLLFVLLVCPYFGFTTLCQTLDLSFGTDGFQTLDYETTHDVKKIVRHGNDHLLILANVGRIDGLGYDQDWSVARVDMEGVPDVTFADSGTITADFSKIDFSRAVDLEVDATGNIYVLGSGFKRKGYAHLPTVLVKLNAGGVVDSTFADSGTFFTYVHGYQDYPNDLVVGDSGQLWIAGGASDSLGTISKPYILRLNGLGVLDSIWGTGGVYNGKSSPGLLPGSLQKNGARHASSQEYYGLHLSGDTLYAVGSTEIFEGVLLRFNTGTGLDTTFANQGQISFAHPNADPIMFTSVDKFGNDLVLKVLVNNSNSRDFEFVSFDTDSLTFTHHRIANADDDVLGNLLIRDTNLYLVGRNIFAFNVSSGYYSDQFVVSKLNRSYLSDQDYADEGTYFFEYDGIHQAGANYGLFTGDSTLYLAGNIKDTNTYSHMVLCRLHIPVARDTVTDNTGTNLHTADNLMFKIFPNPVSDRLTVMSSQQSLSGLEITDGTGQLISSEFISFGKNSIDVSGLANGIYFIKIAGPNQVTTRKFIKTP